jgi:DNA-binding GntR family transcriptional regulator
MPPERPKRTSTARAQRAPVAAPAADDAGPAMAADSVYTAIYEAVLDHRLAPGSRLREEELGEAFGVSRTTVRQALHRLAQDGVILLRPNRGAQVPEPTRRDGAHVFEARRVVECEVVRRVAGQLGAAQVQELKVLLDAEDRATRQDDVRNAIRLSGEFHRKLVQLGGNPIFTRLIDELLPTTSLLIALYKAPGEPLCVAHDHRKLLKLLTDGTPAAAAAEMKRHLNEIERSLSRSGPPPSPPLRDVFKGFRSK